MEQTTTLGNRGWNYTTTIDTLGRACLQRERMISFADHPADRIRRNSSGSSKPFSADRPEPKQSLYNSSLLDKLELGAVALMRKFRDNSAGAKPSPESAPGGPRGSLCHHRPRAPGPSTIPSEPADALPAHHGDDGQLFSSVRCVAPAIEKALLAGGTGRR